MPKDVQNGAVLREPLAIIGIGCRFPGGVSTPEQFWAFLHSGQDGFSDVPPDRWDIARFFDPHGKLPGTAVARQGGFIDQPIDKFDARFFGISPREAAPLDPQQRLLLEASWEAFEDAGVAADALRGSATGVYIGGFSLDALLLHMDSANRETIAQHTATSATLGMLANRLSYFYDFRGPSLTIDTACSSSLVALNYACHDLWSGRTKFSVVGGVNVMLKPEFPIAMSKGGFLAKDSRSKAFDSRADGYARGEGVGVVLLKPLVDAQSDGDRIYAAVHATGVNQDGRTDGITVPSGDSQTQLIRQVYAEAGISARDVVYFEAHGTGTAIGDPIEIGAMGCVFRESERNAPCLVGSVKANIGHLEAAAGIAGVIKSALCLHHAKVPAQLQIQTLNPQIPFDEMRVKVPLSPTCLPSDQPVNYASVNSFGYGGTNAHAVLGSATAVPELADKSAEPETPRSGKFQILPLSAQSMKSLSALAASYTDLLTATPESLEDICYTAARRRSHLKVRRALFGASAGELVRQLSHIHPGVGSDAHQQALDPVFVMTGMGPQWWAMGRTLLHQEPVFRQAAEDADAAFAHVSGWSVLAELVNDEADSQIACNWLAQPANFVVQVALSALLESRGVIPGAIVGHSVGEVSAAYVAGALSLQDAAMVSFYRSQQQQRQAGTGHMLAVRLDPDTATAVVQDFDGLVSVAAINSPESCVLSGEAECLQEIVEVISDEQIPHQYLTVEVPYHSALMEPIRVGLLDDLQDLRPGLPMRALYSSVTARRVNTALHDANYWWNNVRQPVRFDDTLRTLLSDGYTVFLEVGPHPVLGSAIAETAAATRKPVITVATLHRKRDEASATDRAIAALYESGCTIDFSKLYPSGRFVPLPLYPWQRGRHWMESEQSRALRIDNGEHPLLGSRTQHPEPAWQSILTPVRHGYLWDHRVQSSTIFPGAGFVEMGLAVARSQHQEINSLRVEDVLFETPLVLVDQEKQIVRAALPREGRQLVIYSRASDSEGDWHQHARMRIAGTGRALPAKLPLKRIRETLNQSVEGEDLYDDLARRQLDYGPSFRSITRVQSHAGRVLAELCMAPATRDAEAYFLHPTILDGAFQSLIVAAQSRGVENATNTYIPVSIASVTWFARPSGNTVFSLADVRQMDDDSILGDLTLCDTEGSVLAVVEALSCQRIVQADTDLASNGLFYLDEWDSCEQTGNYAIAARHEPVILLPSRRTAGDVVDKLNEAIDIDVTVAQIKDISSILAARPSLADGEDKVFAPAIVFLDSTESDADLALLDLIKALGPMGSAASLIIVVQDLHEVTGDDQSENAFQAALWGIGRTILSEFPHWSVRLVDVSGSPAEMAHSLLHELGTLDSETEVAWRSGCRHVRRLRRAMLPAPAAAPKCLCDHDVAYQVNAGRDTGIDGLGFSAVERTAIAPDEVELQVSHAALNFKDVLKLMGILPRSLLRGTYFGESIGMEGAMRVIQVGDAVTSVTPGDAVVATVPKGCFRSFTTVRAKDMHCVPCLPGYDPAELAGMPIVFVTAYYALHGIAGTQPGERVLIHSAAGGVGLAAIQVAQWLGADVIATAGSKEKRQLLRSLGVSEVYDSRSLDFADNIPRASAGQGVDVILNHLSGEGLDASLRLLNPFGRMIDIGKRDIQADRGLPMGAFDRGISFTTIDIDRMLAGHPDTFERLLGEVWKLLQAGHIKPIQHKEFAVAHLADACREMSLGHHTGKLIARLAGETVQAQPLEARTGRFKDDAVYLVTGGLTGFGAQIACWLAQEGAGTVVLVGRRGANTPGASELAHHIESLGSRTIIECADVRDLAAMAGLIASVETDRRPLKGVFHAAAVLADGLLMEMREPEYRQVMDTKAGAAQILDTLTRERNLDYFVLFSSVSALVGNAGQGNYVAANCVLDAIAHQRHSAGFPALSVNFGAIDDVGMLARNADTANALVNSGIHLLSPDRAIAALERALDSNHPQLGIVDVDWSEWATVSASGRAPRMAEVVQANDSENASLAELRTLLSEMEPEQSFETVHALIAEQIAQILRMGADEMPDNLPLKDMGMDSLTTIEVQLTLERTFGISIPAFELSQKGGSKELALYILSCVVPEERDSPGQTAPEIVAAEWTGSAHA